MHKELLEVFYNKINKKEYDLQIWLYNIHYTNIIAIKDVFISEQIREKKELPVGILDITASIKMFQAQILLMLLRHISG